MLRLATTTSTADSGLLGAILPAFEKACGCRVDVIAVGTGQAIELGRRGDADVLVVHARKAEEEFVAEGHGRARIPFMFNDFVIVGPAGDPAGVARQSTARGAFAAIAAAGVKFASRGDRSGTHSAEQQIWANATGVALQGQDGKAGETRPAGDWYLSLGQGMGETLVVADEQRAYALSDRGTWLAMRGKLRQLRQVFGGARPADNPDPALRNQYAVIVVSSDAHPGVREELARRFATWLVSPPTQKVIGEFGVDRFGQPLFRPNAGTER